MDGGENVRSVAGMCLAGCRLPVTSLAANTAQRYVLDLLVISYSFFSFSPIFSFPLFFFHRESKPDDYESELKRTIFVFSRERRDYQRNVLRATFIPATR